MVRILVSYKWMLDVVLVAMVTVVTQIDVGTVVALPL